MNGEDVDETHVGEALQNASLNHSSHQKRNFERRLSATSRQTTSSKYKYRLGILRTVDLSGETLENYSSRGSIGHSVQSSEDGLLEIDLDADQPNELKATVVMETLITAADVAHNLQGWEHMAKWSTRLYMELRKAFAEQRGSDPHMRWFENQIGFLESYLLPLARRLEDTGVFGDNGTLFPQIVEDNRDRWLTEGYDVSQATIEEGNQKYPIA